jgi:hypothetical protein
MLFLKTTVRNNFFLCSSLLCTTYYMFRSRSVAIFRYTYIKYTKSTTLYVNGSVEIAAYRQVPWSGESKQCMIKWVCQILKLGIKYKILM